jgi:hypothetical protein
VQCALIAQRYSPSLKNFYQKKKSRGTGKAIIALAQAIGNHLSHPEKQLGV